MLLELVQQQPLQLVYNQNLQLRDQTDEMVELVWDKDLLKELK